MSDLPKASNKRPRLRDRVPAAMFAFALLHHGAAILCVAALIALPLVDFETLSLGWQAARFAGTGALPWFELGIHLAIAGCAWASIYLGWTAWRAGRREAKDLPARRLRATRGAVMTETLVVLPVILLLTFGLAQLAVTNIAGILTNLASVQAARSVWLWFPESESSRRGVKRNHVVEMARLQAAASLTPAAPGDYHIKTEDVGSEWFDRMRGIFIATQMTAPPNDSGRHGRVQAVELAKSTGAANADLSFFRSLDSSSFNTRSARKFTFAYLATEVEVINAGEQLGARLTYKQNCGFPFVARIFGKYENVGGRSGFYSTIVREFSLNRQRNPNARMPRQ